MHPLGMLQGSTSFLDAGRPSQVVDPASAAVLNLLGPILPGLSHSPGGPRLSTKEKAST